MDSKRSIEIPVTTANLISSLLRSAHRAFYQNGKYLSAFEAEKAADFIQEKVKAIEEQNTKPV